MAAAENLLFNYDKANEFSARLDDSCNNIKKYNKELETLLQDMGSYWNGAKKDQFIKEAQGYIDAYNSFNTNLENSLEKLRKASKTYLNFDTTFASREI